MSWCGKRSPARWRIGPKRMAVSLDLLAAPAAAPVATWSPTITALAAQPDCVQVVLADLWHAADEILDVVVLGVDVAARELVGTA